MKNFGEWYSRRLLSEITPDVVDRVTSWIGEKDKPFDNLFGDKWRIMIPLRDPKMLDLKDRLEAEGYEVDLDAGKVYRDIKNQRGTTRREQKIGRILQKSKNFTQNDVDWWSTVAAQTDKTKASKYSIIISRHPIDVVRMSDHKGIESCHSQGGDYFQCAVAEAMGHGPIAYLVKTDDVLDHAASHNPDEWLQQSEVFKDEESGYGYGTRTRRDVSGIEPLARVRFRRYEHKYDDYEIAIPEERIYGSGKSGFLDTVVDWSRTKQKEVFDEKPDMDDFTRTGGSYQDNPDSDLFNQFYDTDEYSYGNVDFEGEEEDEYRGMADVWEEETEAISEEFNSKLKHCGVWCSVDVLEDGRPYTSYDGRISVTIPVSQFKKKDGKDFWQVYSFDNFQGRREIEKKIYDVLGGINYDWKEYTLEQMEIGEHPAGNSNYNTNSNAVVIHWNIIDQDREDGPDAYRNFCEWIKMEFDDQYDQFRMGVIKALADLGWVNEAPMHRLMSGEQDFEDLKNFHVWKSPEEGKPLELDAWIKLGHLNDVKMPNLTTGGSRYGISHTELTQFPGFDEFYKVFLNELLKIARNKIAADAAQKRLPGMGMDRPKMPFSGRHIKPIIRFRMGEERMVYAVLGFEVPWGVKHGMLNNTLQYIKYLDDNFKHIVGVARRVFEMTVKRKFSNTDWSDEKVREKIPWSPSHQPQADSRFDLSYGHPSDQRKPLDYDDMQNRPERF